MGVDEAEAELRLLEGQPTQADADTLLKAIGVGPQDTPSSMRSLASGGVLAESPSERLASTLIKARNNAAGGRVLTDPTEVGRPVREGQPFSAERIEAYRRQMPGAFSTVGLGDQSPQHVQGRGSSLSRPTPQTMDLARVREDHLAEQQRQADEGRSALAWARWHARNGSGNPGQTNISGRR